MNHLPRLLPPPRWSAEQLEVDRQRSIKNFRKQRLQEPLEAYLEAFDERFAVFSDLIERSVDLTQLSDHAINILTDPDAFEALRYLAGPPISLDDLKVGADVPSLSAKKLEADPALAQRLINTVLMGLDRHRFPWVNEQREPTESERSAAVLASAALLASQRVQTARRSQSKNEQEDRVEAVLSENNFDKVQARTVNTSVDAPSAGQFCRESMLGSRKADVLVGLWDTRLMPIECKVSNSATNSIKRLNNDAAQKAVTWRQEFGEANIVPTAVLSGVYKLKNLVSAQNRELTIFWAHDLGKLTEWIASTQ